MFRKPEPPEIVMLCPGCGCSQFTGGGQSLTPLTNGVRVRIEVSGAVLSCLGCGARWYTTPQGLKVPHEAALPPAWAMHDLQKRASTALSAQPTTGPARDPGKPPKRMAGPHEGFVMPPKAT